MTTWEAFILGIIQGLAEFLPISSSGHIIIGKELFGIETKDLSFEIVVHAATVLSTIIVFRKDILLLIKDFFAFKMNPGTKYVLYILVSMIPVMIVGFFLKDYVESLFGEGLVVVGVALICTSLLLYFSQRRAGGDKDLTYKSAFIIGISQAIAVIPGLSRSGATISTGIMLGVSREKVAGFSFLMVLIPVLGETFLELVGGNMGGSVSSTGALQLGAGFLTAFITGLIACRAMILLVKRAKLSGFAVYCALAGLFCILAKFIF